jgi:hypothetical protein
LLTVWVGLEVREAVAAPSVMYVRWVGDRFGRQPDGAQLRLCDWQTISGQREYVCAQNEHDLTQEPPGVVLTNMPDPIGGIGSADIDGDGNVEFLALSGSQVPGFTSVVTGQIGPSLSPSPLFSHVTFEGGFGFSSIPNVVGFGVGHAALGSGFGLFVAHSADQVHLSVDIFSATAGTPKIKTLPAPVPFTKIIAGDPTNDFLGFTIADWDGNGVDDILTLRRQTGANGMPESVVDVFNVNGFPLDTVTLQRDPITAAMGTSPAEQTTVVGFMYVPLEDPNAFGQPAERELIAITAERDVISRPSVGAGLTIWRFDRFGNSVGATGGNGQAITSVPGGYEGIAVLGFAGFSKADFSCNGLDDDLDGQIDEDFVTKSVPNCGGLNCGTGNTACANGQVVTQCPATSTEILDGVDNDCNGTLNDIGTLSCPAGSTDWWCCPTGEVRFAVNQVVTASGAPPYDTVDETTAANACLPVGVAQPGAVCNLRGVVRRAEQLRAKDGVRPACRVIAELAPGTHQLSRALGVHHLRFGAGVLTLKGMGSSPESTIIEPHSGAPRGLLHVGMNVAVGRAAAVAKMAELGEHMPELVIQNLTMRRGYADGFSQAGGGAILDSDDAPGGSLTIEDSLFDLNHATQEGGAVMFWTPGALTVRRSLFRNNESPNAQANALGGAIAVREATATVEASTFARNFAKVGGAFHAIDSQVVMLNNTLAENTAVYRGAGIAAEGTTNLTLRFNTITKNRIPADDTRGRGGSGINTTTGVNLTAFGNIIAENEYVLPQNTNQDEGTALDCHIGGPVVAAGKNLIGASGPDCLALGAIDRVLIGDSASFQAQVRPQFSGSSLPAPANAILCQPGSSNGPMGCTLVCANAANAAGCVFVPGATSPAQAAFGSGASPSGDANTCPLLDQGQEARPNTACTLGSIESNTAMRVMSNGDVQYSIVIAGPAPAYVEAFVKQNGTLNVSGDIRSSQVANGDGSFTYKRIVPASRYVNGDRIEVRFYFYRSGSPGVFVPGPTANTYLPATTYRSFAVTPLAQICKQSNNDMRFALTLNSRQSYVEAFVQQNGVQTVAGQITAAPVVNMNGTVTYTRVVPASKFKASDVVRGRFYYYKDGPGVFRPGPGENIFYPSVTYGTAPRCP